MSGRASLQKMPTIVRFCRPEEDTNASESAFFLKDFVSDPHLCKTAAMELRVGCNLPNGHQPGA